MSANSEIVRFSLSGINQNLWGKLHILLQMAVQDSEIIGVERYQTLHEARVVNGTTLARTLPLTRSGRPVLRSEGLEPFAFSTGEEGGGFVRIFPDTSTQSLCVMNDDALIVMAWLILVAEDYPEHVSIETSASMSQWRRAQSIAFECGYTKRDLPFELGVLPIPSLRPPAFMDFRA